MAEKIQPVVTILPERITELEVVFDPPEWGWLMIRVPLLLEYPIACSEVDDPFDVFLGWLEDIVDRKPGAVWQVPEEGSTIHVAFIGARSFLGDDASQLIITRTADTILSVSVCVVSRRIVVDAFYNGFRQVVQRPDYDFAHWERPVEPVDMDALTEEEEDAIRARHPFWGEPLRTLRSAKVEEFLATPPVEREDDSRQQWEE